MPPLAVEPSESFSRAKEAFAGTLTVSDADVAPPDLGAKHFQTVLFTHIAALAAVKGERIEKAIALLDYVVGRERDFWAKWVRTKRLPTTLEPAIGQAATLATLSGGAAERGEARKIIKRAPLLDGESPNVLDGVALLLHDLYPGERWLEGIRPDVLGEHLVAQELGKDASLLDVAVGEDLEESQVSHALTVLTRLAGRQPEQARWLDQAFRHHLDRLAEPAMAVAVETGDPIGVVLAKAIADRPNAARAEKLTKQLPEQTVALRELAFVVISQFVAALRAIPDPKPLQVQTDLAGYSNNLANRLSDLGRYEESLAAIDVAVGAFRALADARPGEFRHHLAMSLNSLANRLSELGRREEALAAAQEAAAIYRALAEARPDAFRPDLATSVNNLGNVLSALGRREEALAAAEEAVEIRRALAEARPDAFRPDLATSVNNLGNVLSALGRREEALAAAEEAAAIYRALAEARPDAFRPDLAMSVNNLASFLSELGRREEALAAAEEAVEIRRALAEARPDAFRPDLAASVNNLAGFLSDIGRREEALAAAEEAAAIYRALAEARPDAFRPDLVSALGTITNCYSALGRNDEALRTIEEAVARLTPAFLSLPGAFAELMGNVTRHYLRLAEETGVAPDAELLEPIAEVVQRLQAENEKDAGDDESAPES